MTGFAEGQCRQEHVRAAPVMALDPTVDCHLGDFHVLEITFRPGQTVPVHAHENARLVYVLSGAVAETYNGQEMLFGNGSFSFHPAIRSHRNDTGPAAARALIIELCTVSSRDLLPLVGADIEPFCEPAVRLRSTAIELSCALASADSTRDILVEAVVLDLVARAARMVSARCDPVPRPQFLDEARLLIASNPSRHVTLSAIGAAVGVTARQLADAFRIHDATTFRAYVREERVARARHLLAAADCSIADVALATGFSDQSHLTRVFRSVTGVTPSAWRDQSRTCTVESF
jgi:AraC-like DNA-binding protein